MPSSYTTSLRLVLPVTGELQGTWGDTVNDGITSLVDASIAGTAAVAMSDANYTLTTANEAPDEARCMFINLSGTLSTTRDVICPAVSKLYFVHNATNQSIVFKTSAGTGVTVASGSRMVLYCNATNVVPAVDDLPAASKVAGVTIVTVSGTQTLTNKTLTSPVIGTIVNTGTLTLPTTTDTLVGRATTDTLTNKTLTSPTINTATVSGGTINNASVGASTPSTGAFTSLTSSSTTTLNGTTIPASKTLVTLDDTQTLTNKTLTAPTISGGTINNASVGASTPSTGAFTTLTATADSAFTSTGALAISKGTTAERPGSPTASMLRFNTTTAEFEGYNGTAWASVGGAAIVNDTSTSSNLYPLFANATTGTASTVYTGNAKLLYKPSTGELQSTALVASNGLVVNSATVAENYTIPTGSNAMSAGPVTINGGVAVTVPSGSVWTVI